MSANVATHVRGGNCWIPREIYDCAKCAPKHYCDTCHKHGQPRGQCGTCAQCPVCDFVGAGRLPAPDPSLGTRPTDDESRSLAACRAKFIDTPDQSAVGASPSLSGDAPGHVDARAALEAALEELRVARVRHDRAVAVCASSQVIDRLFAVRCDKHARAIVALNEWASPTANERRSATPRELRARDGDSAS